MQWGNAVSGAMEKDDAADGSHRDAGTATNSTIGLVKDDFDFVRADHFDCRGPDGLRGLMLFSSIDTWSQMVEEYRGKQIV